MSFFLTWAAEGLLTIRAGAAEPGGPRASTRPVVQLAAKVKCRAAGGAHASEVGE